VPQQVRLARTDTHIRKGAVTRTFGDREAGAVILHNSANSGPFEQPATH